MIRLQAWGKKFSLLLNVSDQLRSPIRLLFSLYQVGWWGGCHIVWAKNENLKFYFRDSSVSIVNGLCAGQSRLQFLASRPFLGPPPSLLYRGSSPRVKRPGREANRSSPSSVEGENESSYTSSPPVFTMARIQLAFSLTFAIQLCQLDANRTKNLSNQLSQG